MMSAHDGEHGELLTKPLSNHAYKGRFGNMFPMFPAPPTTQWQTRGSFAGRRRRGSAEPRFSTLGFESRFKGVDA